MKYMLWSAFAFLFLLTASGFPQAPADPAADAAKEKVRRINAIVDQALTDVGSLRLPENRAIFYARIGNVVWTQDQEKARGLFRNAAGELIGAQNIAELKKLSSPNNDLLTGNSTRQQILNTIAARDAELALELLVPTRPPALQRAMASEPAEGAKIGNYSRGNNYLAQNESYFEQNLYRIAAEQSPDHAVKILKEALAKGLSNDTFNQLTRLAEKDGPAATAIASQVVDNLLHASYVSDGQPQYINIQLTQNILNSYMSRPADNSQKLKYDDQQMRDLAGKFISAYLTDQRTAPYIGQSIVPVAEKFSPTSLDQIKKMTARMSPQSVPSNTDAAFQKLMGAEVSPEAMLAGAKDFPTDNRRQLYQSAANKLMSRGDTQLARSILSENFTDEARDQQLLVFDIQNIYNLIAKGKFDEAEQVTDGLPDFQRVQMLVALANAVLNNNKKENQPKAAALLAKAGQLTTEKPESSLEMSMLSQVISGYCNVDQGEAMRIFEGLVPKINDLTDAAAVLYAFQGNQNVREGEFVMTQGDPFNNYGINSSFIALFAKYDFDRTVKLIDTFTRQEIRISLRLQLASNFDGIVNVPIRGRGMGNFTIVGSNEMVIDGRK